MAAMTDESIIELFFQRDEAAIEETSRQYGAYCFRIAENILGNREDSEECLNDAWMRTWDSIPPAHPVNFRLFLAKITRNLAFDRYRKRNTRKRGGGETALVLEELEECIAGQPAPGSGVETIFLAEELRGLINEFVRELPEKEGNVFIRRYFYADAVRDISKRYLISENHVRVMLNRTRKKLKVRLEKEGYLL